MYIINEIWVSARECAAALQSLMVDARVSDNMYQLCLTTGAARLIPD